MTREQIQELILPDGHYAKLMDTVVEPYLAEHMTAHFAEREAGKKIFYIKGMVEDPRGLVIISHGYTETIEKYKEIIYYFLKAGYCVYMPEHCGHGRSYRLTDDPSLVHVDDYHRYVNDLLFITRLGAKENPGLPIYLFGHSMGGGIAAATAAADPKLFQRVILNSPMIRPSTGDVPWMIAGAFVLFQCKIGNERAYVMGHQPYQGKEPFEDSAATSRERFDYYQEKKFREPLFQMSAASYGWSLAATRLSCDLLLTGWKKISCPVLIFEAEEDQFVSLKAIQSFARKLHRRKDSWVKLVHIPESKHETFSSSQKILEAYWLRIFRFLSQPTEKDPNKS